VSVWIYLVAAAGSRFVGLLGEISPRLRLRYGIHCPVFAFELGLSELAAPAPTQMTALPRHPGVARDVSLLVELAVPAIQVEAELCAAREPLLQGVTAIEDYRDPAHVPAGKKALLFALSYRAPDRTLTDAEVDRAHEALVRRACETLGALRR
jgi:phenylalanyl-tRNA synthetase beta chain